MSRIYLDYAAATPLLSEVGEAMRPYEAEHFGNAHAGHEHGRNARAGIENSRKIIADSIHAKPSELIFTSSGTESNSLAVIGTLNYFLRTKGNLSDVHIITSAIEHPSVLECFKDFEEQGARTSYIGIDRDGILDINELKEALTDDTVIVSIMYANNEIGTIQPIAEIGAIIKEHRGKNTYPYFHTDASQAPLFEALDVESLGVDLLSVDAQKLYGPKGVGGLYIRNGINIRPIFIGGSQERGLRPSTVNTAGVVGFGKAYEIAEKEREESRKLVGTLRDYFIDTVLERLPQVYLNGSRERRLSNNANFSFPGIEGEYMAAALDEKGISVSTKSACIAGGGEGSYVIAALDRSRAKTSVRFTLGKETTKEEIDIVIETVVELVEKFQKL